jgi:hypothetical protein
VIWVIAGYPGVVKVAPSNIIYRVMACPEVGEGHTTGEAE